MKEIANKLCGNKDCPTCKNWINEESEGKEVKLNRAAINIDKIIFEKAELFKPLLNHYATDKWQKISATAYAKKENGKLLMSDFEFKSNSKESPTLPKIKMRPREMILQENEGKEMSNLRVLEVLLDIRDIINKLTDIKRVEGNQATSGVSTTTMTY